MTFSINGCQINVFQMKDLSGEGENKKIILKMLSWEEDISP